MMKDKFMEVFTNAIIAKKEIDKLIGSGLSTEHLDAYLDSHKKPVDSVANFKTITAEMAALYARKNKDYGNSFDKSLDEDGLLVSKIRLGDKQNRFGQLIKNPAEVDDESIRDTLIDMANYAIMTVMWLDAQEETYSHINSYGCMPGLDTDGDIYVRHPHLNPAENMRGRDMDGDVARVGSDTGEIYG